MAKKKATGNYETREELAKAIKELVLNGATWKHVAHVTGVSTNTAHVIYYKEQK